MDWGTRNKQLDSLCLDELEWQKYYSRYQQEYLRKRLRAIKLYYTPTKREDIAKELNITYKTLSGYLDMYILGGLSGLVTPIVKPRLQSLKQSQQNKLKQMVLHESPEQYSKKGQSGH